MNVTSPKDINMLLKGHGLSPLKKFGQNFLCDENIVTKIAREAVPEGGCVLEVGTGLGALTNALAKHAKNVVSVEIDEGLLALHRSGELPRGDNVRMIAGDILGLDIAETGREYFGGTGFYVCGNLPYYITSKIIMHVLQSGAPVRAMTVMVQKEVAQRLAAQPGDTDYGSITAAVTYFASPQMLFTVSRNCFLPAPDVDSAIVRLDMKQPLGVPFGSYSKVVRAAFAMRRKTIMNNLKQLAPPGEVARALDEAGLEHNLRAQDISAQDFAHIALLLGAAER